jgi:hypothetical protein
MVKLSNIVEIAGNNKECVVLIIKDGRQMDLILLGCFDGNEKMIRITKGDSHTATIFKDGSQFSWHWGRGGHTLVSDSVSKCGELIQECVEEDFGIYIGSNKTKINNTLHIKKLGDCRGIQYTMEIMYWEYEGNCMLHKDGEFFKGFSNLECAKNYLTENYKIIESTKYMASTGCVVEKFVVTTI